MAESENHGRDVCAFAAEALFVKPYLHVCCDSSRSRACPDRGYVELDYGADFSAKICFGMSKRGMSARHRCRAVRCFRL